MNRILYKYSFLFLMVITVATTHCTAQKKGDVKGENVQEQPHK